MLRSAMANDDTYPELISLAVHELRTPIGVVGGYLRMVLRDQTAALDPRHRHILTEAEKSCARVVALISELSEIGKIDDGRVTFERTPIELFGLVADVAAHVHEAEDRGVHLEVRGAAAGASIEGDAERLRGAFAAIFRAILREKPGPATVVAERRTASVNGRTSAVVVVADEDSVQAAYDSAEDPFDDQRGGLGLLLPMAVRVIAAHSGRVWSPRYKAESEEQAARLRRGAAVVAIPLRD